MALTFVLAACTATVELSRILAKSLNPVRPKVWVDESAHCQNDRILPELWNQILIEKLQAGSVQFSVVQAVIQSNRFNYNCVLQ